MSEPEARLILPVGERDHAAGPESALITLVEYGDYECPYCGQAYPIVKAAQEQLGDRLRFIFRNFPISTSHPHAQHAAEAAEAASAQGKFWEMHDLLYERQRTLGDRHLFEFAQELDLDLDRFEAEMVAHHYADRVQEDFMSGVRSGVNGTPTFFLNGLRYDERWDENYLIEALLRAAD